ncbi:cold shock domain-containing protein [Acinetobacter bouvetii]|uniref:'Cold-shock' DNA-binding domain protein n=1 Tax=Acinetobacter bouvetii TaxID=202951 RepID=A0A811GFY3_9GAMM|nr:cold shock domain-containing protein [Acinetobacter bouvetii]CAB1222599.1 'Cold-shock' DNA-binding domain protein [Acinetobacter bouvetii]
MFTEGKIKSYNVERGFGFIKIQGEKKDLFFHIKDFPNKSVEPKIGENLKFRIVEDNGKLKADNIVRLDVQIESVAHTPLSRAKTKNIHRSRQSKKDKQGGGFISSIIALVIIGVLIYIVYGKYQHWQLSQQVPIALQTAAERLVNSNPNMYRCDGRIHCSQMSSYEEAVFFINHCPGTKMDGDNDGEPCENDSRW